MAVQVRLFAALRDAAGTDHVTVPPGPLDEVLGQLGRSYGEVFRRRLAVSTVIIDGTSHRPGDDVEVGDGADVALLPPVSGGAG